MENFYFNSKKNNNNLKKYENFKPILLTIARLEKRKNHKKIIYAVKDLIKVDNKKIKTSYILIYQFL